MKLWKVLDYLENYGKAGVANSPARAKILYEAKQSADKTKIENKDSNSNSKGSSNSYIKQGNKK